MRTFEPGEDWFWDYAADDYTQGPALADPEHRPLEQTVPGPAGRVPDDWRRRLH